MTVEFSRRFTLVDIGSIPKRVTIEANEAERIALAARFDLASLERLTAEAEVAAANNAIEAIGTLRGELTQTCVATGQALPFKLDESFRIRFEAPDTGETEEEFELSAEDCDVMEHDGQAIDLGEAVAQTLGLAIDPFPRAPDADETLKAAGIMREEDASPFARLKGLFDKS